MLERGINVVPTTSVGRLFDAVACITGVARENRFEGQAAMLLENEIGALRTEEAYPLPSGDWGPLISAVDGRPTRRRSRAHDRGAVPQCVGEWIVEVAARAGV